MDVKGFSDTAYKKTAHISDFGPILKNSEKAKDCGIHVEVVTNIIPGFNDDDGQLKGIALWIYKCLGSDTPWHVTRFYPNCKLSHLEATPITTLEHAQEIGINSGLRYVYLGNVPGHKGENTYCYNCGILIIERYVFDVVKNRIQEGKCHECGVTIAGRF